MNTSAPRFRSSSLVGLCIAMAAAATGCGTTKQSSTARTGTEQLLLTKAWDTALAKIDFRPLTGVPVYLDTANATAVDQGWVVSSLKEAMLRQGVLLRTKPEQAQWIVEARIGAYGTDAYNWLLGIPQTTVPPTFTGVPAGTIPEISLIKKSDQRAVAKMALFAYDRTSGQLVWTSGTSQAGSDAKDTYVGGVGPISRGSIRDNTEFIGMQLPLGGAATPETATDKPRDAADVAASPLAPSAAASDAQSFAP
ncbi:MAG: hypothetical protein P4L85_04915 [Paludisphaera borealis]|uniref:DUF6655 family protein n=1 Tax=Paludisphaera borealis TaxID=1387353 RepID=UPI002846FDE0|nr:DUF6655 family protein [Paludisphaera borealis]MDR3618672.1 hypothetical protein [Paludisphaera borealis]